MILLDSSQPRNHSIRYRLAVFFYLLLAILPSLGLLGKLQLVQRIVSVPALILYSIAIVWLFLPLAYSFALRARRIVAPIVFVGIVIASCFIYPRMQGLQKGIGRGSDQPDCIIVAAKGIAAVEWPYNNSKLWSHNPMSCGPGWVLLQTPAVVAAGYRWNLLALWILALLLLKTRLSYDAVAGILTLIGLSAITWVAASDGTDCLTFGILLAALIIAQQASSKLSPLYLLLLTLAVQFRFPMLILPVLFFRRKQLFQGVMVSLAAFACNLFFLAWRPEAYISAGPLHVFYMFNRTYMFGSGRWTAILEVSSIFACMLGVSLFVRKYFSNRWIVFAYLFALMFVPSVLDVIEKYHGSILYTLGVWQGAAWLNTCLPLATILLLSAMGELHPVNSAHAGSQAVANVEN